MTKPNPTEDPDMQPDEQLQKEKCVDESIECPDTSKSECIQIINPVNSQQDIGNSSSSNNSKESTLSYPKAFSCPITKELLENPVVTAEGISYERRALESRGDDLTKVYENRALRSIIAEAVEYKTSSSLKKFQHSVLQFSQQLVNEYHRPLNDGYYCPITLGLIHVPVIDPEGYTYEKVAIESWIRCNGASPVTRRTMSVEDLYPNRTLAALMEEEKMKSDDLVHPTFKEWKNEPAPTTGIAIDLEAANDHRQPAITFPTTPEQLAEATRRRRIRQSQRCVMWIVTIFALGFIAWTVPVMSTVLLICVLLTVGIITGYASRTD